MCVYIYIYIYRFTDLLFIFAHHQTWCSPSAIIFHSSFVHVINASEIYLCLVKSRAWRVIKSIKRRISHRRYVYRLRLLDSVWIYDDGNVSAERLLSCLFSCLAPPPPGQRSTARWRAALHYCVVTFEQTSLESDSPIWRVWCFLRPLMESTRANKSPSGFAARKSACLLQWRRVGSKTGGAKNFFQGKRIFGRALS